MAQPGPRRRRRRRTSRSSAVWGALLALLSGLLIAAGGPVSAHPGHGGSSILVFSKTAAFRHDSIPAGIAAIQQLGAEHEFTVAATEDAAAFTDENLAQYDAVVWLSTTGDVLNDEQQAAFERYIQAGGGYAGVHAASDTEYDWPWYGELVGAYFQGHPRNQDATIQVADRTHPSTQHLPAQWERFDEWYSFRTNPRGDVHVLASLDESTYDPEANPMGLDHPIAWCHTYDGGRAWYTAGGHTTESYAEPEFLQHLLGGIETAAGATAADCGGTVWDSFDKVPLDTGTANPMELDVATDGRVFYVERAGEVRMIDPESSQTTVVGTLDVYTQREDGLLGIALDPAFAENGWIYLYYSPAGTEEEQRLSRFTLTGTTLDLASEVQLLEVPVDRAVSGHAGGSLSFDAAGNLYLATGDDTNPFESQGYAPIDERPGRAPYDAQRSSSNTDDLRGKVLRIHPEPDGTYTVPDGNLFAPGTAQTRPEIYAMGFRNPFRIEVDGETGAVLVGDYGPDAPQANPDRGTEGQVEWNRITAAGNYGWPYCHGAGPFRDWDFATQTAGPPFDCANPVNDSPNNTGLTQLPPVTAPDVYYGRSETGTNRPELGTGGGAMAGPVYRYDEALDSDVKWPEYYDGAALFYEWTNTEDGYVRPFDNDVWEFRLDGDAVHDVNPLLTSMEFLRPMDMTFGPDGALYLIEWGTGFGGNNADSGVYRIEYTGGGTRPVAQASADPTSGALPLTVAFSSEGSGHPSGLPVTYHWAFGDGAESTEPNPTHTYTVAGQYSARLTVTAEDGATRSQTVQITAGNTAPEVTLDPPVDGGFFDFGDDIAYGIEVADAEDGSTGDGTIGCDGVDLQVLFGHAGHAHPVEVLPGCEGTVATSTDEGHPAGEDLFWVLEARYTDEGGAGVGALTGRDLHVLQPKLKEAEHYQTMSGIQLEATSDPRGGRQNIGFIDDGDYISYDPMNLAGIDAITYRLASGGSGGRIEIRSGAPDGPLVSDSGFIPPTGGWQSWTDVTVPVEDPGGTHELFFVFRHEPGSTGLFNLNYLKFRGKGVSADARPEIWSVEATPPSGELPYEVTLSAEATDPEGRELTYTWDLGDGTTATGAQVTHTYELSGVYRPTVTVTDAAGSVAHDSVRVEAVPQASPPIECTDPGSDPAPDDEFDGDRLDGCRWDAVVRPDLNRFRVEGGQLKIDTTPTNLFDQHNNAPNLMLQTMPAGDWVVETKVSGDVCERWQQGGLLVYESDRTFLKLDYVGTSPVGEPCARKIEMRHEIDDVFQPAFPEVTLPDGVTTWWLRLERSGTTYTGYYSADGVTFEQVGVIENDRLATADVGLYAFGQEQTQATTVAFDWFHVLESTPPDACPDSDESPTVVIRDVDSGVPNYERDDGCTVEDLIEDEIEWPNEGRFMLHVRSVTQHLVHGGVLTRTERDAIIDAAGRS